MGDISSYPTRTTVAGTDRLFLATGTNADIDSATLDLIAPTIILGSTTLAGVGTLVLESGTLTGSNGGTSSLGTATITFPGSGGGFSPGPIVGETAFNRDALSTFGTSVVGTEAATYTDLGAGLPIQVQQPAYSSNSWDYRVKATPSLPYTITSLAEYNNFRPGYVVGAQILLVDSGGKFIAFSITGGVTGDGSGVNLSYWNSPTSFNTNNIIGALNPQSGPLWIKVTVDSTYITAYFSSNGINWALGWQASLTGFLSAAPVGMGFGINAQGANDYFDMSIWNWQQTSGG